MLSSSSLCKAHRQNWTRTPIWSSVKAWCLSMWYGWNSVLRANHCRKRGVQFEADSALTNIAFVLRQRFIHYKRKKYRMITYMSSIARRVLTQKQWCRGVRVKGGRGGIRLHSSIPAKMHDQHFWGEGVIRLLTCTHAKMHSQQYWVSDYTLLRLLKWSAILEGRGISGYSPAKMHGQQYCCISNFKYQVTQLRSCKSAYSAILNKVSN